MVIPESEKNSSNFGILHEAKNTLGEGLFLSNEEQSLYWLDIKESKVFRKDRKTGAFAERLLSGFPSAILGHTSACLLICNERGIAELDFWTGSIRQLGNTPFPYTPPMFRSNDGTMVSGGGVLYGTMEHSPTGKNGCVCLYNGGETSVLLTEIGIPNGFVWLSDSEILIVDSLDHRINLYSYDSDRSDLQYMRCWYDFSAERFTPDGGCTDATGNVYFALWDGSGIAVFDTEGVLREILTLPVPRPTNCKMVAPGTLCVTSAREGLGDIELIEYPLSGSVFEINVSGGN